MRSTFYYIYKNNPNAGGTIAHQQLEQNNEMIHQHDY